jgi:hypothetical protein
METHMLTKIVATVGFTLILNCAAMPAFAQESLGEKKKWREQEEFLAKEAEQVTTACEKAVPGSFVKPSFKDQLETNNSIYGFCAEAYSGLRNICADPDGKAAVKEKISKFECSFGGTGKRALSLKDGTLQMSIDWEASNYGDFINEWLLKNL